jgi:serine/threonine-protein kinase
MSGGNHRFARVPVKGQLIGEKWRIERTIGVGGMGVVLAATDVRLGKQVAIKVLAGEAATTATRLARFAREARAASGLQSDHVVRVVDVGALPEGGAYLVMEFLEGENLRDHIAKRKLPLATCVEYALQAAEALAEAHQRGIVHRDLKPANLFITRRPDGSAWIKVLDFGLSKDATDPISITRSSAFLGSPLYMAPEQLTSAKHVDGRADVWSLGVVLFELISGEMPFSGETLQEIVGATMSLEPRRLREVMPDVSPKVDAAVARCLTRDPDERFQTMSELAHAFAPFGGPKAEASADYIDKVVRGTTKVIDVAKLTRPEELPRIPDNTDALPRIDSIDTDSTTNVYPPQIERPVATTVTDVTAVGDPPAAALKPASTTASPHVWTPRALRRKRNWASAEWVTLIAIACLAVAAAVAVLWVTARELNERETVVASAPLGDLAGSVREIAEAKASASADKPAEPHEPPVQSSAPAASSAPAPKRWSAPAPSQPKSPDLPPATRF